MTTDNRDAWMLNQVLAQPEVLDAILVSSDGIARAYSPGLDQDTADHIAAALSGVQSTSNATARFCRAPADSWQQSLVEFDGGYVITIRAHASTTLAVATTADADVGQVVFRMHEVVGQMGREMGTAPRQDAGAIG